MRIILTSILSLLIAQSWSQTSVSPNECIAPFYHGIASGDPLTDRVIIWTRVTPLDFNNSITVNYKVSLDSTFNNVVSQGNFQTDSTKDFTVKIDVIGLQPNTFYYYEFEYNGSYSAVGRTKTMPVGDVGNLRLAIVSCANLEAGYFNVYDAINARNDVDAVLMLGDYIYEYETGGYSPNAAIDRTWQPDIEITDLSDYRLRYSSYHMDYALRKLHQNYPWICIWDDHETANNTFKDGAENHTADEGNWQDRKENGKRAFFEWLPIRPKASGNTQIFRSFEFGNLANIIMLDTRLEGRDEQAAFGSAILTDTARTILGQEQFNWLKDELSTSTQAWKILGNQVMMGEITALGTPINNDGWDGYPAERTRLYNHIQTETISNFVVATGDIHTSWALNLENGNFPVGVEFVTPSVTSPGIPLNVGGLLTFENQHLKYVELTKKGFVILDVTPQKLQGDWYYVNTIDETNYSNSCQKSFFTNSGSSTLIETNTPAVGHGAFPIPLMPSCSRFSGLNNATNYSVVGVYPNPTKDLLTIQTLGTDVSKYQWSLVNSEGKIQKITPIIHTSPEGSILFQFPVKSLPSGLYYIQNLKSPKENSIRFIKG